METKRCFAEIDLSALRHNYWLLSAINSNVICVVKADAYGHGAKAVAETMCAVGCRNFAVTDVNEAKHLLKSGICANIFVLGFVPTDELDIFFDGSATPLVYNDYAAKVLNAEGKRRGRQAYAYLKIDTGMNRLGYDADGDFETDFKMFCEKYRYIKVEGVMTHFACADKKDADGGRITAAQAKKFIECANVAEKVFGRKMKKVCCNSAAALKYPEYVFDGIRAGLLLYGLKPSADKLFNGFLPVMTVKAVILDIKTVRQGEFVGYGKTYVARRNMRLATVAIGYADGYTRRLSNVGYMLVNGEKARIAGSVTMDYSMIDVTNVRCAVGDYVTVFDGSVIDGLSRLTKTINYETICAVSARVPRIYKG